MTSRLQDDGYVSNPATDTVHVYSHFSRPLKSWSLISLKQLRIINILITMDQIFVACSDEPSENYHRHCSSSQLYEAL